jgi:hypothetical protein
MKDITTTSFGLIIAYLLPGSVGLYGLSFLIESLKTTADKFFSANADVGLFLTMLAAALVIGLQVNVLRWMIYEKLLFPNTKLPQLDYGKLQTEDKLKMVLYIIEENYRYHQFYGGMSVIMPVIYFAFVKMYYRSVMQSSAMLLITVLLILSLLMAVSCSLMRYYKTERQFESRGYSVLIGACFTIGLLSWCWLIFVEDSQKAGLSFTLLTVGFLFLEVVTGAAAYSARARYINRATQITEGA